jgi:hypothetical protein
MTAVDYYRTDSEYSCIPESQEYIAVENRGRHGGVHFWDLNSSSSFEENKIASESQTNNKTICIKLSSNHVHKHE